MANTEDILNMMDQFLTPIQNEKQAAHEDGDTPGDVIDETMSAGGKEVSMKSEKGDEQGATGQEKREDINDATGGTPADSAEADNKDGGSDKPTDDQGPSSLDSDEAVSAEAIGTPITRESKVASEDAANARVQVLGTAVLDKLAGLVEVEKEAKDDDSDEKSDEEEKAEAKGEDESKKDEDYEDMDYAEKSAAIYELGYLHGYINRGNDHDELVEGGLADKTASEVLTKVAMENPEATLPEEAYMGEAPMAEGEDMVADAAPMGEVVPEGEVALGGEAEVVGGEDAAVLDEVAEALAAEGVSPEQFQQAVEAVEQLQAAGVSPEEILDAAGEVQSEEAPAAAAEEVAYDKAAADTAKKDEDYEDMDYAEKAAAIYELGYLHGYINRGNDNDEIVEGGLADKTARMMQSAPSSDKTCRQTQTLCY
jgi:hypothetical protein